MQIFKKIDQALFKGVSWLAQGFLVGAVLTAFYQVVARFVLQSPLDWSEVLTRAMLIWSVLLGIALAFRQGAMLGVDMLRSMLPVRSRILLEKLIALLCSGFLIALAIVGGQMTWRVRFQTMPSLDISISWIYVAIPIGAALAAFAILARVLNHEFASAAAPSDAQG